MNELETLAAAHTALLARLVELRKPFEVLSNERPPFEHLPEYILQLGHCPECGPTDRVDEDGCCLACGADSMVYLDVAAMLVRLERLENAARLAVETFGTYVDLHRAKGTPEGVLKAAKNAALKLFCEQALAR